ncbi:Hypothetical protein NCS54_00981200 [Fusarium falciforme]|uniref:Hypothetical protein n=1 Tax=Fusarium falciforme TaxID=195108 RepID=UPI0023002524|nr:Hypothetical protein NCS54_00981200 [Fusarium falciforme]WAO92309.1 Hypothetical protein NCS54_00981200 [Fusarium falciforme]
MATPPTLSTPRLSYPWIFSLAKALENSVGPLPCPVATQGAELVPPPETPALRYPPPDPAFVETLTERLEKLAWRQRIRINIYGVDFAEEWPISRTPRLLAKEAAARRIAFLEKDLHLDSSSTSESEGENERRILRLKKMLRRSRKQTRPHDAQLPSPQSTTEEEAGEQASATKPSLKRKRSEAPFAPKKAARTWMELPAVSKINLPSTERGGGSDAVVRGWTD